MKGWGACLSRMDGLSVLGEALFWGAEMCEAVWVRSWVVEYCLQSSAGLGGSFIWLIAVKM
ncbi:hypothetical protein [Bartonella grahamii]|uniref:hypothetical protein n=1 Tax=Bartonella grahamii TaxID=33045 RepID=UPI002E7BCB4D|nr:hypothetical protein [Bartonella grahamii]